MRVEVSGKQFAFPRVCACCGRFPGTRLTLSGPERNRKSQTSGWVWDVPYCKVCADHVKATDTILLAGLGLITASGILAFIGFALGLAWQWCLAGLLGFTALISLLATFILKCKELRGYSQCASQTRAIKYLGSSGSCHSFDIRSRDYCTEFVRANRLKLVNASSSIGSIVKELDVSEHQVARRLTKKSS